MLVVHFLHEFDFPLHGLASVRVAQLVLLVDLHRHLLVAWFVQAHAHHSVGTLPDLLADDVVVQT